MGYPKYTNKALCDFTTSYRDTKANAKLPIVLNRPAKPVENSKPIYYKDSGMVPHYTGHIPGMFYFFFIVDSRFKLFLYFLVKRHSGKMFSFLVLLSLRRVTRDNVTLLSNFPFRETLFAFSLKFFFFLFLGEKFRYGRTFGHSTTNAVPRVSDLKIK